MRPRSATGWTALVLGALLIGSNLWWLYQTIDDAITNSYQQHELAYARRALNNALTLIPKLEPAIGKAELVAEAEQLFRDNSFEKDGCVWVGSLGLKFDDSDTLVHVSQNSNFGHADPCFPD